MGLAVFKEQDDPYARKQIANASYLIPSHLANYHTWHMVVILCMTPDVLIMICIANLILPQNLAVLGFLLGLAFERC